MSGLNLQYCSIIIYLLTLVPRTAWIDQSDRQFPHWLMAPPKKARKVRVSAAESSNGSQVRLMLSCGRGVHSARCPTSRAAVQAVEVSDGASESDPNVDYQELRDEFNATRTAARVSVAYIVPVVLTRAAGGLN